MKNTISSLLISLCLGSAWSLDFYGNQSGKKWQSTRTPHFNLIYEASQEKVATEGARIAELAYDSLSARYGVHWSSPADLVIQDALFSNGEASSHADRVKIWATDWGIPLRSYHPWLGDVIHHEFAHLASISLGAKIKPWLFGLHVGVTPYDNSPIRQEFSFFYPFTSQPSWFAEGTAQYESERLGMDRWDAHRDMIMRRNVQQNKILSLEQMQSFIGPRGLDFELGPYTQGFSLVRYIAKVYGDSAVISLWKNNGKLNTLSFDQSCRKVLGKSERALYQEWLSDLKLQYGTAAAGTSKLVNPNFHNISHLRLQDSVLWGLSDFGADEGQSPFYVNLSTPKDSLGFYPDSAFKSIKNYPLSKIAWEKGFAPFSQAGKSSIFAVSFAKRDAQGLAYYDLVRLDSGAKEPVFISKQAQLFEPELSPDQKTLYAIQKSKNSACMSLVQIDLSQGGDYEIKPLLELSEDCLDQQIRQVRVSPNGQKLTMTLGLGNKRVVLLYDLLSHQTDTIMDYGRDQRDPVFTDDSTILLSSDIKGRFSTFVYKISSKQLLELPISDGGHFYPQKWDSLLVYVDFDSAGFGLYQQKFTPMDFNLSTSKTSTRTLPWTESPALSHSPYSSIPRRFTLLPALLIDQKSQGIRGSQQGESFSKVGALFELFDPLEKNQLELSFFTELKKSSYIDLAAGGLSPDFQRDLGLSWKNQSTPINSTTMLSYRRLTQQDTLKSEDPRIKPSLREYGIRIWTVAQKLDYSLWKKKDQFSLLGSYLNAGFDFYQNNFSFTFLKSYGAAALFDWSAREKHPQNFLASPGFEGSTYYGIQWNDLFRQGTFSESFKVNSSGVVTPIFRDFTTHTMNLKLNYHLAPTENSRISFTTEYAALPYWSSSQSDTLDRFFLPSVRLHGYPSMLPNGETPLLAGRSHSLWTTHAQIPLWTKIRSFGFMMQKGAWLDLFGEQLWLWQDNLGMDNLLKNQSLQTVGAELRLSQKIFYSIPLEFYVRNSWALRTAQSKEGSWEPKAVWSDLKYGPTAIEWGLSFRFAEPGEVSLSPVMGINQMSAF